MSALVVCESKERALLPCPRLIADAGERAVRRFLEFFVATIRNRNTRQAYGQAVGQFFAWCDARDLALHRIDALVVSAYVEQHPGAAPTVKQHLAAIRMLFNWLASGGVVPANPAAAVRGPRHVVRKGKTPVLSADEARGLFDAIDTDMLAGLRDRALIGVMVFSFARVGAVTHMRVGDYYQAGKRWWFRLHEKGGRFHEVPAHHRAEAFLDAYLERAGIAGDPHAPLFQSIAGRTGRLTGLAINRRDALAMVKRRAQAADLPESTCNHSFRATGITVYLKGGGTLEKAQAIAAHSSPESTKLYDRTSDELSLDEIERIVI